MLLRVLGLRLIKPAAISAQTYAPVLTLHAVVVIVLTLHAELVTELTLHAVVMTMVTIHVEVETVLDLHAVMVTMLNCMQAPDLYDPKEQWASYLINALKAKELQIKDVNYITRGEEVIIVDEFTGRTMPGRRCGCASEAYAVP